MPTTSPQAPSQVHQTEHAILFEIATEKDSLILVKMIERFAHESGLGASFSLSADVLKSMLNQADNPLRAILIYPTLKNAPENESQPTQSPLPHQPIGFILLSTDWATFIGQQVLHLQDIWIEPEWRGKGIGEQAMTYLQQYAKEHGYARIQWECAEENVAGQRFYRRIGGVQKGGWQTFELPTP